MRHVPRADVACTVQVLTAMGRCMKARGDLLADIRGEREGDSYDELVDDAPCVALPFGDGDGDDQSAVALLATAGVSGERKSGWSARDGREMASSLKTKRPIQEKILQQEREHELMAVTVAHNHCMYAFIRAKR